MSQTGRKTKNALDSQGMECFNYQMEFATDFMQNEKLLDV